MNTVFSDEEQDRQRLMGVEERWKIIFNQQTRAPIFGVSQYVDYLKQFATGSKLSKQSAGDDTVTKTLPKDGISPVSYLLRKLKLDLKMSYESFVEEFLDAPNNGMKLLVGLLKEIQTTGKELSGSTNKSRLQQYKKSLTDEYDCLLCIKFSFRVQRGVLNLLEESYGLETIAMCLMSSFTKSRDTAIEILTLCLSEPEGFTHVIDSFTYLRLKFGEPVRFKLLVSMMNSQGRTNIVFQLSCMQFINTLLFAARDPNTRVFLQHEIEMAGLDLESMEKTAECNGLEYEELRREIEDWKRGYINVGSLINTKNAVTHAQDVHQHEIERLRDEIQMLEESRKELENQMREMFKRGGEKSPRSHLPDPVERPTEKETREILNNIQLHQEPSVAPKISSALSDEEKRKMCRRIETKRPLPLLHWTPLHSIHSTLFQTLDDENVFHEMDFTEFEEMFHLEERLIEGKRKEIVLGSADACITFVECTRAKTLSITQRQIGLSATEIRKFIVTYDYHRLSADGAEQLLRFVPTREEMEFLSSYSPDYQDLADAEKLIYQFAHIDRLEARLKLIAFMGQFTQTISAIRPQMDQIEDASASILNNLKIRKLFEIILAFGNYMNSKRRGSTLGFRLSSLPKLGDVRSTDGSQTLLQFIVKGVENKYPGIHDWHEDLQLNVTASYQSLASEMKALKDGMNLLHSERDSGEDDCPKLEEFYQRTYADYQDIQNQFEQMEQAYGDACSMFGENPKTVEPKELFGHFSTFATAYKENIIPVKESEQPSSLSSNRLTPSRVPQTPTSCTKCGRVLGANNLWNSDWNPEEKEQHSQPMCNPYCYYVSNDICETCNTSRKDIDPYDIWVDEKSVDESVAMAAVENWIVQTSNQSEYDEIVDTESHIPKDLTATPIRDYNVDCTSEADFPRKRTPVVDFDDVSVDSAIGGSGHRTWPGNEVKGDVLICYDDERFSNDAIIKDADTESQSDLPEEPPPDYSIAPTPVGTMKSYSSEISRILNEFEGNLYGHERELDRPRMPPRFVTIKPIIYL